MLEPLYQCRGCGYVHKPGEREEHSFLLGRTVCPECGESRFKVVADKSGPVSGGRLGEGQVGHHVVDFGIDDGAEMDWESSQVYINRGAMNPNENIDGATWNNYREKQSIWAVQVPVDAVADIGYWDDRTDDVELEGGDYLYIEDGRLQLMRQDAFEERYEEVGDETQ